MVSCHWLCAVLAFATLVPSASAFVDSPVLVPEHPVAGETVSISVTAGECDDFMVRPGYPQISRNSNSIRVVLASIHASSANWCIYPVGTTVVPIGALSPGSYTLQVDRTYQNSFGEEVTETLDLLIFSVGATPDTAVPTLGSFGIGVLLLGVLLLVAVFIESPGTAE